MSDPIILAYLDDIKNILMETTYVPEGKVKPIRTYVNKSEELTFNEPYVAVTVKNCGNNTIGVAFNNSEEYIRLLPGESVPVSFPKPAIRSLKFVGEGEVEIILVR